MQKTEHKIQRAKYEIKCGIKNQDIKMPNVNIEGAGAIKFVTRSQSHHWSPLYLTHSSTSFQ